MITNIENNMKYIGQTIGSIDKRWNLHKNKCSHCLELHNDIEKYGDYSFVIKEIDIAYSQDELDTKEIYWIHKENTIYPNGYNKQFGGLCGTLCENSRSKMGKKGKLHWGYGEHRTNEEKLKISNSKKGKCKAENNPFYGKHHSEESKQKIRDSKNTKKVICLETGDVFLSSRDAQNKTGIKNISKVCKHERKSAGDKHWEYIGADDGE